MYVLLFSYSAFVVVVDNFVRTFGHIAQSNEKEHNSECFMSSMQEKKVLLPSLLYRTEKIKLQNSLHSLCMPNFYSIMFSFLKLQMNQIGNWKIPSLYVFMIERHNVFGKEKVFQYYAGHKKYYYYRLEENGSHETRNWFYERDRQISTRL